MVFSGTFFCTVAGAKYYVRDNFTCNFTNDIYLNCINCKCQYVGSAISFKQHFHIHKPDIKTKKDRCGTARYFIFICFQPINPHCYLKVTLTEKVFCNFSNVIWSILWEREKFLQCQLFANTHGMNSMSDLYSRNRKRLQEEVIYL